MHAIQNMVVRTQKDGKRQIGILNLLGMYCN